MFSVSSSSHFSCRDASMAIDPLHRMCMYLHGQWTIVWIVEVESPSGKHKVNGRFRMSKVEHASIKPDNLDQACQTRGPGTACLVYLAPGFELDMLDLD